MLIIFIFLKILFIGKKALHVSASIKAEALLQPLHKPALRTEQQVYARRVFEHWRRRLLSLPPCFSYTILTVYITHALFITKVHGTYHML